MKAMVTKEQFVSVAKEVKSLVDNSSDDMFEYEDVAKSCDRLMQLMADVMKVPNFDIGSYLFADEVFGDDKFLGNDGEVDFEKLYDEMLEASILKDKFKEIDKKLMSYIKPSS